MPDWNVFSLSLVKGTMDIAAEFLADEGFLVTLCLAEHFGKVASVAWKHGLRVHRTWTLFCDGGYRHPVTLEEVIFLKSHVIIYGMLCESIIALSNMLQVCDLTVGLFYREDMPVPDYDREAGAEISPRMFPASRSYVVESETRGQVTRTLVDGVPVRGGAERSYAFFRCGLLMDY